MNAFIILEDNRIKEMPQPANADGTFSLEQMQLAVGGYIARGVLEKDSDWEMWADEEGVLKGKGRNDLATWIAGMGIVGDVLITTKEFTHPQEITHPNVQWAKRHVVKKHPKISDAELATLRWDSTMRCYLVEWSGMLLGIETTGEIHS